MRPTYLSPLSRSFLCGGVSNANGDFVIPCEQKQAIAPIVAKEPRGPYNYWDESASNLSVYYQLGNWRITATGYWLLNDAKYKFETIDNPILSRKEWHTIKDNNRMVSIGVSWNFFSGKKKDIQKNINNRDADSGAFK